MAVYQEVLCLGQDMAFFLPKLSLHGFIFLFLIFLLPGLIAISAFARNIISLLRTCRGEGIRSFEDSATRGKNGNLLKLELQGFFRMELSGGDKWPAAITKAKVISQQ